MLTRECITLVTMRASRIDDKFARIMEAASHSGRLEKLLSAFENEKKLIEECQDIALDIRNDKFKLLSFVEELGPLLTDKTVATRARGTLALSITLAQLPTDFLNETELNYITIFFCDRMKDNLEVLPAVLRGILAIIRMDRLPQDSTAKLLSVMFQHVHCQSQLQPDRRSIYLIFQTLLETRINELRGMGPDFIYGIISAIDGERDPRNLILLFHMLPNLIKSFPLGHLTEEMFEVIACYFPVDFNSSATEGQVVTREELAHALAPCLYAVPEFAEFCLPLTMERLDSSLKQAKLDSLDLIRKAAPTFGASGLKPHLEELWPLLRKEVFPGGDVELRNAGLETITELIRAVSPESETRRSVIEKIITDTKSSLCDVQLSLFWPAEKLLEAVARASVDSCSQILKVFVPLALGQYSTKTLMNDRVTLIESLNNFIRISDDLGFTIKSVPELGWTDVPLLYLNALDVDFSDLKTKVLAGLVIQKSSLSESVRQNLYEKICQSIDAGNNEIRSSCQSCLSSYAKTFPTEILELINRRLVVNDPNVDSAVFVRRLEALSTIARIPELAADILACIVSVAKSENPDKSIIALSCLRKLVAARSESFDVHNFLYKNCNVIDLLLSSETGESVQKLSLVASICRSLVKKLDSVEQQRIINKYGPLLCETLVEKNVILLEGLLTPLQKSVEVPDVARLFSDLSHSAINGVNANVRNVSAKLISVLINKRNEDPYFHEILNSFRQHIRKILDSSESELPIKESAIVFNTWLTKALVVRGSKNSQDYLDFHINMLREVQLGRDVANGFQTLADRFEDTLTEDNFCNVKLFYRQRIFQNMIQRNKSFDAESRENYLIALTHLVEEVPMELLLMHILQLVPLLMEAIALDNDQLILSTLITLKSLLQTDHEIFAEQVQHFIPRFLTLSTHNRMKVRIASLECLLCYTKYPTVLILPFKSDVLEGLIPTIDDRKRLVRQIAVRTRTRWYLVGSPGEPGS